MCIHCKRYLESELSLIFKDLKFEVDFKNKYITISGEDFNINEIINKIEELGYIVKG